MADYHEGRIKFSFPDSYPLIRPEDCSYYKRHFQNFCGGCKEMDFIFYEADARCLWLLEVKDYRTNKRQKPQDLVDEITQKVRDSLACLLAGKANSNEAPEAREIRWFMEQASGYATIRVVLHLEDHPYRSNLFNEKFNLANFTQKLRQKLKAIDPHSLVSSTSSMGNLAWKAEWTGS